MKLSTSRQQGFSALALIFALPLLLSLLAGSAYLSRGLYQWNKMHHECQKLTLDHQNDLRRILTKLLALNPKAKKLRIQKTTTQVALAAAVASGQTTAIAIAKKRLARIIAQQKLLHSHQQLLLGFARALAQKFKWSSRLKLKYEGLKHFVANGRFTYPLAVEPFPKGQTAPEYRPVDNFERKQNIGLSFNWALKDGSIMPQVLSLPAHLKVECGSTLKQENTKWFTHLSVARPWLKL